MYHPHFNNIFAAVNRDRMNIQNRVMERKKSLHLVRRSCIIEGKGVIFAMSAKLEDTVEITRAIVRGYYQGDFEPWFSRLCSGSVWLGTGERLLFGDQAIRDYFKDYTAPIPVRILREDYYPVPLNARSGAVVAEVAVASSESPGTTISGIYTFVYQIVAGETKLMLLHAGYEFVTPPMVNADAQKLQMSAYQFVRDVILNMPETKRIPIPVGIKTLYVQPHMIFYVKSKGRKTELYCTDKVILTELPIYKLNEMLPFDFCSIHRAYTVNTRYVTAIKRYEVTMVTGEKLPVPIHGFNEVKADLERRIAGEGQSEGAGATPHG